MHTRAILLITCVGAGVLLQGPLGKANAERRRNDFRYTPNPTVMRVVAGGHQSSFANLLWLRVLPDMSRPFQDLELKERWLDSVLAVVTDLEPSFESAYLTGSIYLNLINRKSDHALRLLHKGVERNPNATNLLRELAMTYYMDRHDREKAIEFLERAVAQPDCDVMTMEFANAFRVKERADEAAIRMWLPYLDHANRQVAEFGERAFEKTKKQIVIRAAKQFEAEHGRKPTSVDDLRQAGLIQAEVLDVVLEKAEIGADGRLVFPRLDELDFAHRRRGVEFMCSRFYEEKGRWPTLDEIRAYKAWGLLPPPAGKRWVFERGKLFLEDA